MYGVEAMTPQELKYGLSRSDPYATPNIDELTAKDLLDGDPVEVVDALSKYLATTKTWRYIVVIQK